jgi:hypothetical protein
MNKSEEMTTVHRTKLELYLKRTARGKIFSVIFIKKDNTLRKMLCRFDVVKGVKGTGFSPSHLDNPYLTVWDMQKGAFRLINLETVLGGKMVHETFVLHDAQDIISAHFGKDQQ